MKPKYTLFLSWQSDINSARSAIDSAIKGAIPSLLDTDQLTIELDESTWNVPGMPKIEDVVKEKIENCDIFYSGYYAHINKRNKVIAQSKRLNRIGLCIKMPWT